MLAEGQEPEIPQHYIVSRSLADLEVALLCLRLTPASAVLVEHNRWMDYERAQELSGIVVMAGAGKSMEQAASQLTESFGRPVIVLGECDFVEAVYADGRRVSLAAHA